MSQSLVCLHVHVVFSTKHRLPLISDPVRARAHRYMAIVLQELKCSSILINSVEDHVHLLFELARTAALSDVLQSLKANSSRWMKSQVGSSAEFAWQNGYAAFAVSRSNVDIVRAYIDGQQAHHRTVSFKEELRLMLRRHGVRIDERYVWD